MRFRFAREWCSVQPTFPSRPAGEGVGEGQTIAESKNLKKRPTE